MPRGKRVATRRGNSHGSSSVGRGASSRLETSFTPFAGGSAPRSAHKAGFSLQEEARNTERHTFWDSDQKLRHAKVNFVSATMVEAPPEATQDPEIAMAQMTLHSEEPEAERDVEAGVKQTTTTSTGLAEQAAELSSQPPSFIIDTLGGQPVQTGLSPPVPRPVSPSSSSSSEEVILFSGRNNKGKPKRPKSFEPRFETVNASVRVVEERTHESKELLKTLTNSNYSADFESLLSQKRGQSFRKSGRKSRRHEDEEALIADYLSNMDNYDDLAGNTSFYQRELGGTEQEISQADGEASSGESFQANNNPTHDGWNRADICDFDDMSTSDGVMGEIEAILSKRERDSGLQYLIVWEDQTVDEARWVPSRTLTNPSALACIEEFEDEERLIAEFRDKEEKGTDSSDAADDEVDEDDEQDLVQRRIDRMTDEKIARLLAKQEELGMDASEVLLFDGIADQGEDGTYNTSKNVYNAFSLSPAAAQTKGRAPRRRRDDFPTASVLADAYDGFDVMDFERPSLKKKPKGRKGKLAFDLSDSELEASMQMAWDNDRVKKKERKQQREELRAQGLLGSKSGKPNLKDKYKEGIGFHSIREEIKNFLVGGHTTLALPPMDKADRKVVHEIANAFNLKSKSAGSGTGRFPILYRTARTSAYVERTFAEVETRLTRRFLPRMDVGGKRSATKRANRTGGSGGFNNAAVSYRDGDIVGGSAPELGVENKGRAMLEKMGWSTGTALGALNNKGILQPVSHVVKTTKAGLG